MALPIKSTPDGHKYLNLGCGNHYHLAWNNLDFGARGTEVIGHNLLQGVPFADNTFDAVYHSHVLEHFVAEDGQRFMSESYRVLKPGGVLRVAVPDLEQIVQVYLQNLDEGLKGNEQAILQHKWSLLELFDQVGRTRKGGAMGPTVDAANQSMKNYIVSRHGYEIKERWEKNPATQRTTLKNDPSLGRFLGKVHRRILTGLLAILGGSDAAGAYQAGLFKTSGELHLQMYDQLLLGNLMRKLGLTDVRVVPADESAIPDWDGYQLDRIGQEVRKPDSLFMEGIK